MTSIIQGHKLYFISHAWRQIKGSNNGEDTTSSSKITSMSTFSIETHAHNLEQQYDARFCAHNLEQQYDARFCTDILRGAP